MIRKAFYMEVKPGKIDAYEKTHNPIWPELQVILKNHGVHNYSIFHHAKSNALFGYLEIEDEKRFNAIADNEICHKWWRRMKEYLVSDTEESPKAKEEELREVFHIN